LGEDAVQNFLAVGEQAKGLLSTFIQAGDPEGARQLAGQLRNQISTALAEQGMNPDQINQFLEASGLTSVQVDAAINFANVEGELLRVQTLISLFETQLRDAPPEVILKVSDAIANNDLAGATDLIRNWVTATNTDPATSQVGIDAIIAKYPELKPALDAAQAEADGKPIKVKTEIFKVDWAPGIRAGVVLLEEKLGFDIPLLAKGGPLAGGQLAVVGEQGPELFVPSTAGTVVSNPNFANMLGSASGETNQTFNIYSTDPMLTASEVVRKQRDAAFMAGV
jgi:hypothetical protein